MMLGESAIGARSREHERLFHLLRCSPAMRHWGYAREHLHYLLDRKQPPEARPLSPWRELERMIWWTWHAFTLLEAQRQRLDGSAA